MVSCSLIGIFCQLLLLKVEAKRQASSRSSDKTCAIVTFFSHAIRHFVMAISDIAAKLNPYVVVIVYKQPTKFEAIWLIVNVSSVCQCVMVCLHKIKAQFLFSPIFALQQQFLAHMLFML
jgi:hypothetical protein